MVYDITCKCGWEREQVQGDMKRAEVVADVHVARDVRRPYRHSTSIQEAK